MQTEQSILRLPSNISSEKMREVSADSQIKELLVTAQDFDLQSIATYFTLIQEYNLLRVSQVADLVNTIYSNFYSPDCESVSIITPGSDGKLEKGPFLREMYSPLEFIILYTGVNVSLLAAALISFAESQKQEDIDKALELKNIGNEAEIVSGFKGNPRHAWPDRVVNSLHITGSTELIYLARNKTFQEWKTNARVRKCVKDYYNQFLATSQTGRSRDAMHFDITQGKVFFDKKQYILGLKYGPIRTLQLFLMKYQLEKDIQEAPANTVDKMLYLFGSDSLVQDAAFAYMQSLRIYHWQQFEAKSGNDPFLQVTPQQLSRLIDPVVEFVSHKDSSTE